MALEEEEQREAEGIQPSNESTKKPMCAAFSPFVLLLSLVAGLGGFLFGYDTGVISGAILFIETEFDITHTWEKELIVSGTVAGAVVGSIGSVNTFIMKKKNIKFTDEF